MKHSWGEHPSSYPSEEGSTPAGPFPLDDWIWEGKSKPPGANKCSLRFVDFHPNTGKLELVDDIDQKILSTSIEHLLGQNCVLKVSGIRYLVS